MNGQILQTSVRWASENRAGPLEWVRYIGSGKEGHQRVEKGAWPSREAGSVEKHRSTGSTLLFHIIVGIGRGGGGEGKHELQVFENISHGQECLVL